MSRTNTFVFAVSFLFFTVFSTHIFGQITFHTPNQVCVNAGDTIWVPVNVDGFQNILGFQFSLNWDTTELKFIAHDSQPIPLASGQFNLSGTNQGEIGLTGLAQMVMAFLYRTVQQYGACS